MVWTPDPAKIITAEMKAEALIPQSVSSRQFKMQLYLDGLLEPVTEWIASQDKVIQLAYENSGMFVRGEPMMQQGFMALGVSKEQIDDFFVRASQL